MNWLLGRLLRWTLGEVDARVLWSELEEAHNRKVAEGSRAAANRWRRREVLRAALLSLATRLRRGPRLGRATERPVPGASASWETLAGALRDIWFALRALRRRRMFAVVAVVTLGLGIGAATAMFSVVDAVLLTKLPYVAPNRIATVWLGRLARRDVEGLRDSWNYVNLTDDQYRAWRQHSTLFQAVAMYNASPWGEGTLTGFGRPARVSVGTATASLLPVLGVNPTLGRWFLPDEEGGLHGQAAQVVVLSHEMWTQRFGSDPAVLGRTLVLDGVERTVVGVLPAGFRLRWLTASSLGTRETSSKELWLPYGNEWDCVGCGSSMYQAVGRLAPGVTFDQALSETRAILSQDASCPFSSCAAEEMVVRLVPREEDETRGLGSPLILLLAATGVLLLIACGNIATLSLGELHGRRQELVTRGALGASRGKIVRQLLTESVILGLLGGLLGVLVAVAATQFLLMLAPPIPGIAAVGINFRALAFAAAIGMLAGLMFGTAPAVLAARESIGAALRAGGRGSTGGGRRFQRSVVALEIALTTVLLVTGGLLSRSLAHLLAVDPGFDPENLATVDVSLPETRYPTQDAQARFVTDVLAQLEAVAGIRTVTAANGLPFPGTTASWGLRDADADADLLQLSAKLFHVTPGYFETLGIPLVSGRTLTEADGRDAPPVAVVSESLARRMWPNESPIGGRIRYPWTTVTVVGVVADVQREALNREVELTFYVPFAQFTRGNVSFAARTYGDPRLVIPLLRQAVWSVDGDLAIGRAGTMRSLMSRSASDERYRTQLMGAFALLAAVLAAVGVFGVTARAVAQRNREMGIRVALGARETELVGTMLRGNLITGLAGTGAGLVAALLATRLVSGFLFGVRTWDPTTYIVVAALLSSICLAATYVPARRIARIDPVDVLRAE